MMGKIGEMEVIGKDAGDWMTPERAQVATIGFFDGVHRGHQYLIRQVNALATHSDMESMVITFDRHPRQLFDADYRPRLLSTLDEKLQLLSGTMVDSCMVLPFDRDMASLSAREFMEEVLKDKLNVHKLVIGYDNRFGHDRKEGFDDYVRYGHELGIEVSHYEPFDLSELRVSSSAIRFLVEDGDLEKANECLGYHYSVTGKVVGGFHEGRKIGFPTANIDLGESGKLVPANGVYAVMAQIEESEKELPAMMNIGTRPTYGGHERTLEVYILDFKGELYGENMKVSFISRIRDERKFDSIDSLVAQLGKDEECVREIMRTI